VRVLKKKKKTEEQQGSLKEIRNKYQGSGKQRISGGGIRKEEIQIYPMKKAEECVKSILKKANATWGKGESRSTNIGTISEDNSSIHKRPRKNFGEKTGKGGTRSSPAIPTGPLASGHLQGVAGNRFKKKNPSAQTLTDWKASKKKG